jgi:hypothetical protein
MPSVYRKKQIVIARIYFVGLLPFERIALSEYPESVSGPSVSGEVFFVSLRVVVGRYEYYECD